MLLSIYPLFDSSCSRCGCNSAPNASDSWNRRGISLDTHSHFRSGLLEAAQGKEVRMSHLLPSGCRLGISAKPSLKCQARRKSSERV